MIYSLINPSDRVTFHAENDDIARVTGVTIGRGVYGVEDKDGNLILPILAFIPVDPCEFFENKNNWGGMEFSEYAIANTPRIIQALESIEYVGMEGREEFDKHVEELLEEDRAKFLTEHRNQNRSSINNIREFAEKLAEGLKGQLN